MPTGRRHWWRLWFLTFLVAQPTTQAQESNIERRIRSGAEPPAKTNERQRKTPPRTKTPRTGTTRAERAVGRDGAPSTVPPAEERPAIAPDAAQPADPGAANIVNVLVTVNVPQADIFVGEKKVGVAQRGLPLKVQLPTGLIRLTALCDRYLPFSREVVVAPGTERLDVALDYDVAALLARYEQPRTTITDAEWTAVAETASRRLSAGDLRLEFRALELLAQGQLAMSAGDATTAVERLTNAVRLVPKSAVANHALGRAQLTAGRFAEAVAALRNAIAANPVLAVAHYDLGVALLRQGQSRQALKWFEQAETLGHQPPSLSLETARALVAQRAYDAAVRRLQPLLLEPSAEALVVLGDAYAGKRDNAAAMDAYETAAGKDPTSPIPPARLGQLLLKLKQYARARRSLQRALELDPDGREIDAAALRTLLRKAGDKR